MQPDATAPTSAPRVRPLVVPFATGVPLLGLGPVAVAAVMKPSGVVATAVVLAAIAVGSLVAPAVGLWAEHHARHRHAQAVGLVVAAVGYTLLPLVPSSTLRVLAGVCIGAGSAASFTMTLCNVVRGTDTGDWERRLGVVTAVGQAGAFVGFLVASRILARDAATALFLAAACCVLAAVLVFVFVVPQAPRHVDGADSVATLLRAVARLLRPPFGLFMIGWTLTFTGSVTLAGSFSPVLTAGFGVDVGVATLVLAVAFGLRAVLSVPAGRLAHRVGASRAMHVLQVVRLVACLALVAAALAEPAGGSFALNVVVVTAAVVLVASVAFVAVPSAALSVRLAGDGMAGALGAFFAAESVAIAVGFAAADLAADAAGYTTVPVAAAGIVVVGVLVLFAGRRQFAGATLTDTTETDGSTVSS